MPQLLPRSGAVPHAPIAAAHTRRTRCAIDPSATGSVFRFCCLLYRNHPAAPQIPGPLSAYLKPFPLGEGGIAKQMPDGVVPAEAHCQGHREINAGFRKEYFPVHNKSISHSHFLHDFAVSVKKWQCAVILTVVVVYCYRYDVFSRRADRHAEAH